MSSSPDFSNWNHHHWITYGPDENCTLALCPVEASLYEYRPSLAANAIFIALFGINLALHLYQGFRWRTWFFTGAMFWGCISELVGYGGRVIMYNNPFSFTGFIIQIVCITFAPAFFSAAIYVTLSQIVTYLGTQYSRLTPAMYYYIFITCDIISLTLQATGGGMSSNSKGQSYIGVDIALAGLSFQVFTLSLFICLAVNYAIRYSRGRKVEKAEERMEITARFKVFVGFLCLAIVLILVRCVYRIDELSNGYDGPLIHNEGLFIALEGVMIIVAAFALNVAHPGPVFARQVKRTTGFMDAEGQAVRTEAK